MLGVHTDESVELSVPWARSKWVAAVVFSSTKSWFSSTVSIIFFVTRGFTGAQCDGC
jgi:hypothetical protein